MLFWSHIIIIFKFLSFAFNFVLLLYGIVLYCSVCRVSRAGNGSMGHGRVNGSNGSPIVKNTQNHWCTNRHRSTKTVPTVYQSSKTVKNSQKTVKTAKMTIGIPIVTCLPRLHSQCTNSVPIVKNSEKQTIKTEKNEGLRLRG